MVRKRTYKNQIQIVQEYLTSSITLKELSQKYDIPKDTISYWVKCYRKRQQNSATYSEQTEEVVADKTINKKLQDLTLKNALLEQILKLAEEQTGIDFKKKYGTKQS